MTMRQALVRLHRYVGLAFAGFLFVASLTGALLAWNDELEAAINPDLFQVKPLAPEAAPLDPLALRERVQAAYPLASVNRVRLAVEPGNTVVFRLSARPDPATGAAPALPNDEVFVDPYSGDLLGERKRGDLTQGMKNLMPFIFRLHHSLAVEGIGGPLLGMVALLWTLDCFVGAYLTLPVRAGMTARGSWWMRWRPAWKVRWRGGPYKFNFDLHRATGLWPWALLFVLAWSSVALSLPSAYDAVMKPLFAYQADPRDAPTLPHPLMVPPIDWHEAREIGRAYMDQQAQALGFSLKREHLIAYDSRSGTYDYYVQSNRDVSERWGLTRVNIDARTGRTRGPWIPTGVASGDTIRTWLTTLHMAAVWGRPIQILICAMGLAVAMLSVTGVVIWLRKRKAKLLSERRERHRVDPDVQAKDSAVCRTSCQR